MSSDRHMIIPAVWIIVMNQSNETFLIRRANTGWQDGSWTVPAGHVEANEGPIAAALRELKEEVGIEANPENFSSPLIYFYPEDERIHERVSLFFVLSKYSGAPSNVEPDKADDARWFALDSLPEQMPPLLKRAFIDIQNGVTYSERYYVDKFHKEIEV